MAGFSDADRGETEILDVTELEATNNLGETVGTLTLNDDGTSWSFVPNQNFNGNVKLNYSVTDGSNKISATNSFNLSPVNDIPELTGIKRILARGTEDTNYIIESSDLLYGYTDIDIIDGSTQELSILGLSASNGYVTDNGDSTFTFTPNANFNGTVSLNYLITDSSGGTLLANNTIEILNTNDAPIINGDLLTTDQMETRFPSSAISLRMNPKGYL